MWVSLSEPCQFARLTITPRSPFFRTAPGPKKLPSGILPAHPGMQGLALIDFDNYRGIHAKSRADLELYAEVLVDDISRTFSLTFPESRELDIRLYGGWTDPSGTPSRDAWWLMGLLPGLRGRRHGLIVRPMLATTMLQFPELLLRGTVRDGRRGSRQKMVDGMMGCDAMFMTNEGLAYVGVVSDDDDLLPATISAHARCPGGLVWIRSRKAGSALNDPWLIHHGLRLIDRG